MKRVTISIDLDDAGNEVSIIPAKVPNPPDDRTLKILGELEVIKKENENLRTSCDYLDAENKKLFERAEALKKGRDERQKERDREREKVRKLKEEIALLKTAQLSHDDLDKDLKAATVSEFSSLRKRLAEAEDFRRQICAVIDATINYPVNPAITKIAELCYPKTDDSVTPEVIDGSDDDPSKKSSICSTDGRTSGWRTRNYLRPRVDLLLR